MFRRPTTFALLFSLVVLALFSAAVPSWAHTDRFDETSTSAVTVTPAMGEGGPPGLMPAAAPEPPELLWAAVLACLIAAALGWWRRRPAVALGLVLLLTVVAFEVGLHSVHHGADPRHAATCPVASAAGHLTATAVDAVVSVDVILPAVAAAPEVDPSRSPAASLRPDRGRAPPAASIS